MAAIRPPNIHGLHSSATAKARPSARKRQAHITPIRTRRRQLHRGSRTFPDKLAARTHGVSVTVAIVFSTFVFAAQARVFVSPFAVAVRVCNRDDSSTSRAAPRRAPSLRSQPPRGRVERTAPPRRQEQIIVRVPVHPAMPRLAEYDSLGRLHHEHRAAGAPHAVAAVGATTNPRGLFSSTRQRPTAETRTRRTRRHPRGRAHADVRGAHRSQCHPQE